MTRDDLNELQALAASISAERKGWRAHRRDKAAETARRRLEAEQRAPGRRRRRHRFVAAGVVVALALVGAVLIVIHLPGKAAPPPRKTAQLEQTFPGPVKAGHAAAQQLDNLGQPPNPFACERIYATEQMGQVAGQQGATWHADYIQACLSSS